MSDERCFMCDNGKILQYQYNQDAEGNTIAVPVEVPCPNCQG